MSDTRSALTEAVYSCAAQREALAEALFAVWAALGFNSEGDTGPGVFISGSGYDGFAAMVLRDAREFRAEADQVGDELLELQDRARKAARNPESQRTTTGER